jgi:hypothetical protein
VYLRKSLFRIFITELREASLDYLQPEFALIRWLLNRRS